MPVGFSFKQLQKGEKIIKVVRRHWFNIFMQFVPVIVVVIVMIAGMVGLPLLFAESLTKDAVRVFLFVESIFSVLVWIYSFILIIDFYFDVWIITNKRIINIEQKGLFIRHISELKYENIQDVTVEVVGIPQSMFNYGDLFIQTAAVVTRFIFRQVPYPNRLKKTIMDLQSKSRHLRPQR